MQKLLPAALLALAVTLPAADEPESAHIVTGQAAFHGYQGQKPGLMRKITVADLPAPFATKGVSNGPTVVARPADAWPQAPAGFKVQLFADQLAGPRKILKAPNGDMFVAETDGNTVEIYRGITAEGKPEQKSTFATGLHDPFGIAFYPPGNNPQWIYIGNTNSVVRLPYHNGDLKATGAAQTIIPSLPTGGHSTRDVVFSSDGSKMFVAVGSRSNIDNPDTHKSEFHRANILEYTPEGKFVKVYAAGIRNPVGLAINPLTNQLWCSVNERDMLGDNLVPDYITSVKEDGFYGWPWYYIGNHHDPRLPEKRELADKVTVPDVLLQPHNASLQLTFYEGSMFPKEYQGDIFAGEHGSWNKADRAGYEVIRVPLENGRAKGEYEDFITGFVTPGGEVWGRPVGVAAAPDGSLLVTDDGSKSIWRVIYTGK
ncbi:MAG TPA: sorbosone dehydrogenase family protein [Bryobacteraceae bacterium]